jgi:putative DNA primase/helicase
MTDLTQPPEPTGVVGSASDGAGKPTGKRPAKRAAKPETEPDTRLAAVDTKRRTVTPVRPSYAMYATWVQTERGHALRPGLYFHGIRDDKETDNLVCSPLEVLAITSDERGENFGRLLRLLPSGGGAWREWAAPMEMLAGDGSELRAVLLNLGATIPYSQRRALMDYLMSSTPKRHAMAATRTGWHGPSLFVMPRKVIGGGDVVFQSSEAGGHEYATAGDLSGWQTEVGAHCLGNPILMLAVCSALAGPLLALLDADGGGFHILGDSSSGKSIALLVAASVWGKPRDFLRTWNATSTGLEGMATVRNDTLLVLDEIGEAKPQDIGGIIYALGNGTGRQRGKVSGLPRQVQQFRVMVLSSGELTMGKHMESAGIRSKAGQELRLLDIPAYRLYGAFDDLHGLGLPHDAGSEEGRKGAGRTFADTLKRSASRHYGHLGPAFVALLVARVRGPDGEPLDDVGREQVAADLEAVYAEIRQAFPVGTGQEARAVGRFAIAALAGEMAIQAGLLPWPAGTVRDTMLALFNDWTAFRGRGQSEDAKILRAVLGFINRHTSRFASVDGTDTAPVHNCAGWYRSHGEGCLYLFTTEGLIEAAPGFDLKRVVACLDNAGAIVERESDRDGRFTKRVRIKGVGRPHVYVVSPDALIAATEE